MAECIYQAVVMGASAGAVEALTHVLSPLPRDYPLPVMVVVHLPPDKKSVMTELFQRKCHMLVKEAEDKEPILPGVIYFAPPDYHLLVEADKRLSLSSEEPVLFSRPSIDVLFETAADCYGPTLIGITLTGANSDGAAGMAAIHRAGGLTLVQNPDFAFAAAMPLATIKACPAAHILNLEQISDFLQKDVPV